MEEKEFELIDYINVIWKRKWLIIIPTFFCVVLAGLISFFVPKQWTIDALIMPSKFFLKTGSGRFEEVIIVDPKQIAGQINQGTYNSLIAAELSLDIRKFPKIKSENLKDTDLVRVVIRDEEIEKSKKILNSLFIHLKNELDRKVDIEVKGIDSQIKSNEIEKMRINEEIKGVQNKLRITRQRKVQIEKDIGDIRKRVEVLEKEQNSSLKKENRKEPESLAMLLYSNEIQQSLMYLNTLNELLGQKKIEEEELKLEIDKKEETIKQIENEIDILNEKKGRIDYAKLVKEPASSLNHVFPKRKLILLIALISGLLFFMVLAFFLEYLEKQKK